MARSRRSPWLLELGPMLEICHLQCGPLPTLYQGHHANRELFGMKFASGELDTSLLEVEREVSITAELVELHDDEL